ncbi:MAG: secretin N-terminal domain-containing protein, partial [Methylococcaceae bacterium]
MQKVIEPIMPPKSIIRADEHRNVLLLAGTSEELEGVLETIRLFDVDFMRGMSVGLYSLKNVEAPTLAEELDKVMGDTSKGPLAGVLRLLPIERLNAILAVSTQPRYLEEVETWVERLDRYSTNRAGGVHVYRVQNVDALVLAETLSNIFGGNNRQQRGGRGSLAPGSQGTSLGMTSSSSGGSSGSGLDQDGDSLSQSSSGSSLSGGGLGGGSSGSSPLRSSSSGGLGGSGSGSRLGSGSSGGLGSSGGSGSGGGFGFGSSGATSGSSRNNRTGRGSAVADLGTAKIVADPSNNALIIIAKAQEFKEIEAVIKELDVMPLQVLIDATVVEVTLSGSLQYGLEWYFNHGQGAAVLGQKTLGISSGSSSSSSDTSGTTSLPDINPESLASLAGGGFGYSFINAAKDIRMLLNLLASDNKINVISSPSVMVLNNQEAQINVGDTVPLAVGQSNFFGGNLSGSTVTSSFQYVDTGVILRVRPRVNAG